MRRPRRAKLLILLVSIVTACGTAPNPSPTANVPAPTSSGASPQTAASGRASPSPQPTPLAASVAWSDCGNGLECGSILVPRDYNSPTGASIRISVVRLAASDPKRRIGSLLVNPGGPGGSGIDFVREGAAAFSEEIRNRFDIVGFDPRGVNQSSEIRCVDDLDHFLAIDSTPDTPAERTLLFDGERAFVEGCQRRNGDLLPFVGTANVARDLDRLRGALGDEKLTYLGLSYGTLIGTLYADMFPEHTRALALDGAVDPSLDLGALHHGQARSFDAALGRFVADCSKRRSCAFYHGGRPGPALDALMRRIEASPLRAVTARGERRVGPTYAWSAIAGALYSPAGWSVLAAALALADAGDGSLLLLLSDPLSGRRPDGSYSNLVDANRSVTCLDFPTPRDPETIPAKAAAWTRDAPRFGSLFAWDLLDCSLWPVPAGRTPVALRAPGAPPIVVVGSTGDPATPYAWSQALARQLASATLITRRGEGHTAYFYSRCVASAVNRYLIELAVPRTGLTCS